MKKYFTKYIPVEEKIKEGDKFIADALSKDESPDICIAGLNVDLHLINNLKKYPKVELFLCSRDVQVGDEFNNTEIPNKVYTADIIDEKFIECYKHDCCVPKQYCYKVIGSISPDAIWVEENDEFDENEIRRLTEIKNIENDFGEASPNGWISYPIEKVLETYWNDEPDYFSHKIMSTTCWKDAPEEVQVEVSYNIFEIKGPCGHFH